MPATIHEVATAAGVSVATVSRVFTSSAGVREPTRERVMRAARELGYRPNRAARGLITGRTGNLGLVVPDLGNPYFHAVLKGAQARAREADYAVFIADSQERAVHERALVEAMAKQVDGIVLCSSRLTRPRLAELVPGQPVVLLGRRVPGLPSLTLDSADGMRQAVEHLAALGHERVAFLSGPRNSWSNRERHRGLKKAAPAAGIDAVVFGPLEPQFESGIEIAERVLAAGVSAVLAYNDLIAIGLLHRLHALGVAVPGELSLIGFDDIPFAAMTNPPLTTVAMPTEAAGRAAVELLLERMDSERGHELTDEHRVLPVTLQVRASSGPPAAAAAALRA